VLHVSACGRGASTLLPDGDPPPNVFITNRSLATGHRKTIGQHHTSTHQTLSRSSHITDLCAEGTAEVCCLSGTSECDTQLPRELEVNRKFCLTILRGYDQLPAGCGYGISELRLRFFCFILKIRDTCYLHYFCLSVVYTGLSREQRGLGRLKLA